MLSPRAYLRSVSVVTQTAMISALILSLPVIAHASSYVALLQTRAALAFAVPPVWFLGLEQVLLGRRDPYLQQLAVAALVGVASAIVVIAASYLAIYRRFDQLVLRTSRMPVRQRLWPAWSRRVPDRHPARQAFFSIAGVRTALLLPLEVRANWVFRLNRGSRDQASAVDRAVPDLAGDRSRRRADLRRSERRAGRHHRRAGVASHRVARPRARRIGPETVAPDPLYLYLHSRQAAARARHAASC